MLRVVAATFLLISTAGYAQEAAPPPAAADASPAGQVETAGAPIVVEAQKEKKVCRTEVATGSMMPKRTCRTQAQIAREQEQAQRGLDLARARQESEDLTNEVRQGGGR